MKKVTRLFLKQLGGGDNIIYSKIGDDCRSLYVECKKPVNYPSLFYFGVIGVTDEKLGGMDESFNFTIRFSSALDLCNFLGLSFSLTELVDK